MQNKRYVVQEHSTVDGTHWDLMLEQDDVLATFRLEKMPSMVYGEKIRAEKIFDHPLRFLTYEGPVQQGTGRVRIADRGAYRPGKRNDEAVALSLTGEILNGEFLLARVDETNWNLICTGRSAQE